MKPVWHNDLVGCTFSTFGLCFFHAPLHTPLACWGKSGSGNRTGCIPPGTLPVSTVKKQKVTTWPVFDIRKVFSHFFVIKRKYFSALRGNRFPKGSQQLFRHCTLKHTFQKSSLLFLSVAKQAPEVKCFFLWQPQRPDALGQHLPTRLWVKGRPSPMWTL
jgi:hypothetical protein